MKRKFRDFPIKWKFAAVSMLITQGVLLLVTFLVLAGDAVEQRIEMTEEINQEADYIGKRCSRAMLNGITAEANDVLQSLDHHQDIIRARSRRGAGG